jgi:hypothetical protein
MPADPCQLRVAALGFGKHPAASLEHRYAWHQPEFAGLLTRAIAEGSMRRIAITE